MSTSGDEKLKSEAGLKFLFGGASCCTAALFVILSPFLPAQKNNQVI
jgi:hypothetical protein